MHYNDIEFTFNNLPKITKEEYASFSTYFDSKISFHEDELYFDLYLKDGTKFYLSCCYNFKIKKLYFKQERFGLFRSFDEESFIVSCIVSQLNEKDINNFKNLLEEFDESIFKIEDEEKSKSFLENLLSIANVDDNENFAGKFQIALFLNKAKFGDFPLNIKLGLLYDGNFTSEFDISTFFDNFTYDKRIDDVFFSSLNIHYSFSLLNEQSKRIYDFLRDSTFNYRTGTHNINLSSLKTLQKLIILFKNATIYLNRIPYQVRLKELGKKIFIDDNFFLKIVEPKNYTRFYNTDLFINEEGRIIDILSFNPVYNEIYSLVENSIFPSVKEHKDNFKYSIYLNHESFFEPSKKAKRELKLNALEINSCFDLTSKNQITLKSTYFVENRELKENEIQNDALLVYNRYQEIISDLGFVDGLLYDEGKIWEFLNNDLSLLQSISNVYLSDRIKTKNIVKFYAPTIKIQNANSMLNAFYEGSEYTDEELAKIYDALIHKRKFILLRDNFINLNTNEAQEFERLTNELKLIENNEVVEKRELPPYFAFKVKDSSLVDTKDEYIETLYNDFTTFKSLDKELPDVNATLRPYQVDAFKWLSVVYKDNVGGVLADDMGLGKTLETITFIKSLNIDKPILIVSPTSLIFNRINEFEKFSNGEKIIPLYGNAIERKKLISKVKPDKKISYITSYDSLRNDIDFYEKIDFDLIILDEAQFIKNTHAKKTQSVKKLNAKHRLVLTGTPIENSVLDLWSIFDFLMPGYLPSLEDFKSYYERDPNYLKVIKRNVAPFILRRIKQDVLKDLPPKYEVIVSCEMTTEQRKVYDAFKKQANDILHSGASDALFGALTMLTRLRQICITPSLFVDNFIGESGKLNTLFELINEEIENGNKILLFSQFVEALNIVESQLKKDKISFFKITGQTSSKERLRICDEFNTNNKYKICIISLKAGGTGLNLVGANVVIHLDPWWNYAVEEQASDRAHRIGQNKNVKVIKLISENSVEQRVIELQNIKKEIVKQVVSSDDSSITGLTKDDIKFILENN